ncbi:Aste57867_4569 [Aphanomyces stellatus]|uniref:Aste57867_4569 protein n=1 Tax=Aphanomyces stellatus TaxID=120398 RepID=A0A485KGW1_9STRA|nr:hypothetical protein As57867_004556 [Aphanomyces stellatus]VFT81675.1 Aste57867_4569 [Aphanomyces stellatus]
MTTASMVEHFFKALHASDPLEYVINETENGDELALSKFGAEIWSIMESSMPTSIAFLRPFWTYLSEVTPTPSTSALSNMTPMPVVLYLPGSVNRRRHRCGPSQPSRPHLHFFMTTCYLNGLSKNGYRVARSLKSPPSCVVFQEATNPKQLETFHRHLTNEVGDGNYTIFVNDLRVINLDPATRRHCGVARFFHKSMRGYGDLVHLAHLDVPGRFLVVKTEWHSQLRGAFFQDLPRDFEPDSPRHDELPRTALPRSSRLCGLTTLGVIDVWRNLHPQSRQFSGPGRVNRLDYVFLDHISSLALDSRLHTALMAMTATPTTGNWQLPRELLADHNIQDAVKMETTALLERMRSDPTLNHGALWYGWLKRMKKQLTKCHRLHTESTATTLHNLKLRLASAQRAVDWSGSGAAEHAELAASRLAYDDAKAEYGHMARIDSLFSMRTRMNVAPPTSFDDRWEQKCPSTV